jgi:hypothetical protein
MQSTRAPSSRDEHPTSAASSRYLTNLAALYRCDVELAARIDALPFAALPALEAARDGAPTVRVTADDGATLFVHSRYQPVDEAARLIESLGEVENPTFVVSGVGLGYHLTALERRYERPMLIVVEDELALIKAALCICDLSRALRERRMVWLTRADKAHLHERLTVCNADVMLGLTFVALPVASRRHVAFHQAMRGLLNDFLAFSKLQMVTLLRNARNTFRNVAMNLPAYLAYPGVEPLKDRAAGWPAIVVAAGPSLAANLPQVCALRERAVIIAVQTVFRLMMELGCRPHFVTSLDWHEVSAEFFEGMSEAGDCTLVAEPKAHASVVAAYRGPVRLLHHPFCDELLRGAAPQRGALRAGSSVAHLAFYLAQHLGCDPIILVGQDLCFSDGLYYCPGMPVERLWSTELNRFQTLEMKQWERIARNRPILRRVRDVNGREVYTDEQMFTYAEQFQSEFLSCGRRVIHAGRAGVRMQGVEVLSLREAAERFCTRRLPADLLAVSQHQCAREPGTGERATAALRGRIEELTKVRWIAERMLPLLEALIGLTDRPAAFNRRIGEVDALRVEMQRYDDAYRLVVHVSQAAELRRYGADRRLGEVAEESPMTARRRLRRDIDFVRDFVDGCDWLLRLLPQVAERIGGGAR